ncbi:MAG: type II toxin-antitoxin system Phd/YefM family antitoxin [Isosphaeraceae bacterium]
MSKVPTIVPVSDLRKDAAGVLKRLRGSDEPVFITQRGRAAAVLMSIDAFERSQNRRELLPLLARGEVEIASGLSHSLHSVMAEAGKILAENREDDQDRSNLRGDDKP